MQTLTYGLGARSRFTVTELLAVVFTPEEITPFVEAIGNGLNIGGLNIHAADQVIALPANMTSLAVMAPGADVVDVPLVYDGLEVIETPAE